MVLICQRLWTRSKYDHLAIRWGDTVLESGHDGVRFVSWDAFRRARTIVWSADINAAPSEWWIYPTPNRLSLIRLVARIISGGRVQANDCVSVCIRVLNDSGEIVPESIVTVKGVVDWLTFLQARAPRLENCPSCRQT